MCPPQQGLNPYQAPTLRRHNWLIVHVQFVGADRPGKFAMDEFLIARNSIYRKIEHDDGARSLLGGRAQCETGTARQFSAGRSMAWSLREAGMLAHAHDVVDPVRT